MRVGNRSADAGDKGAENRSREDDEAEENNAPMIYSQRTEKHTDGSIPTDDSSDSSFGKGADNRSQEDDEEAEENNPPMIYSQRTESDSSSVTETPRRAVKGKSRYEPTVPLRTRSDITMIPPDCPAEALQASGNSLRAGTPRRKATDSRGSKAMPMSTRTTRNLRFGPPTPIQFGDASPTSQKSMTRQKSKTRNSPVAASSAPTGTTPIPFGDASPASQKSKQDKPENENSSPSAFENSKGIMSPPRDKLAKQQEGRQQSPPQQQPVFASNDRSFLRFTHDYICDILRMVLSLLRKLAFLIACYILIVTISMAETYIADIIYITLSPLCSIRGVTWFENLPSCKYFPRAGRNTTDTIYAVLSPLCSIPGVTRFEILPFCRYVPLAGRYTSTTDIIYAVLSPLCSIPGVTSFDIPGVTGFDIPGVTGFEILPFCKFVPLTYEDFDSGRVTTTTTGAAGGVELAGGASSTPISSSPTKIFWSGRFSMPKYSQLINLQSNFEKILEDSFVGSSMYIAKRNVRSAVGDLSSLVQLSKLSCREELRDQLHHFGDQMDEAFGKLSNFGARVKGGAYRIVSIDGTALTALEEIKQKAEEDCRIPFYNRFLLAPLRYKANLEMEKEIINSFNRTCTDTVHQIQDLILQAEDLLDALQAMDTSLLAIQKIIIQDDATIQANVIDVTIQAKANKILAELWTYVAGNKKNWEDFQHNEYYLSRFPVYREETRRHVSGTLEQLQNMKSNIEELTVRVVKSRFDEDRVLTLEVHMETIRKGMERLEKGRKGAERRHRNLRERTSEMRRNEETGDVGVELPEVKPKLSGK